MTRMANTRGPCILLPHFSGNVLRHHVVKGRYTAKDLAKMGYVQALDGSKLSITSSDSAFAVDNAHIIKTDVSAGNGMIQVIDTVMIPK